jgi:uncharacterized damage-inducible protein DinB
MGKFDDVLILKCANFAETKRRYFADICPVMKKNIDLTEAVLSCWKTSSEISLYLVKTIDTRLWNQQIPGYLRKTIGMLAAHLHNARCGWIRAIGKEKSGKSPARLILRQATKKDTLTALRKSSAAMHDLLEACLANGGRLPNRPVWLNFPNDVMHLLAYFVAHEAHHRGQIIMVARQLGQPFTRKAGGELWQWTKRLKESKN